MFTEGLETDLTIDGVNYRVDAVVLEQLDKDGEPTEDYSELPYDSFLGHLYPNSDDSDDNQILEIIEKLKTNNEKLRDVIGGLK